MSTSLVYTEMGDKTEHLKSGVMNVWWAKQDYRGKCYNVDDTNVDENRLFMPHCQRLDEFLRNGT